MPATRATRVSGASEPSHEEKPAPGRLSFFRTHLAFLLLFAAAAPLTAAFCWHPVISSLGDDSASYLTLARHLSPFSSDPLLDPWTRYVVHFPPLFPLLLVFAGGAQDILAAHLVVAACALAALALAYAYANQQLGSAPAAFLVAALFLLTPGAWITILGIMSEPLFLAFCLAALAWHERAGGDAGWRDAAVLGLLVSAALLTRTAGAALLAAYAVHVAVQSFRSKRLPALPSLLPIVLPVAFQAAWRLLRPQPDHDVYGTFWSAIAQRWLHDPQMVLWASDAFLGGWVSTFTADSQVSGPMRFAFALLGVLGVAGAGMRAWRNRLDGWYVLASAAMVFVYTFPEAQMRRLLYPIVPVVLVQVALLLREGASRIAPRAAKRVVLAAWALAALLTLPATLLVAQRSFDRAPLVAGLPYSAASTTEYYTTLNAAAAMSAAKQNVVTLAGLELAGRSTPAGSSIMWTRTEYVALLARRPAVALYTRWDQATFAAQLLASRADYVVAARLYKSDLQGLSGDPFTPLVSNTPRYLHRVLTLSGPGGPDDFVLFGVDRAALEREPKVAS
jgi:hypothetical protein